MRNTDERKWQDRWFRMLPSPAKILYVYLSDVCDCAGFLDYDPELWSFETGLSLEEVDQGWKPLVDSSKTQHWVKQGSSEGLVWVKNAPKIQLNYKEIDTKNHFHRGIYKRLKMHLSKFPEIQEMYLGQARVNIESTLTQPWVTGKGKGKGKGILGESEGGGDVEGASNPNYAKLIEHDLHKTCSYVSSRQLERGHPELDWEALVDHVVMTHLNSESGVRTSYTMLAALAQKGSFAKGSKKGGPVKVSAKQKKLDAITAKHMAGEITDDECEKMVAEVK